MAFIAKYWRGELPLGVSFWLVFLFPAVAYHHIEPLLQSPFSDSPPLYIGITLTWVALCRLVVFPWQVVGLLRSSDRYYLAHGRPWIKYCVQAAIVLGLVFTTAHIIGALQSLVIFKEKMEFNAIRDHKNYSALVLDDGRSIHLQGPLDFGITETVAKILQDRPGINAIILDSDGGQIYEGRGLAMLIDRYGLDTYTFEGCISACTTAFISGDKRYLGTNAKLGFHQYRMDAGKVLQYYKYYDMDTEQAKDLKLYKKKKINEEFLDKVFETPHDRMWFPDARTLIDAGVVTGIVSER